MDKKKKFRHFRTCVQTAWTFLSNCYAVGFAEGKIYTGPLKNICFPGLNCYSCPGAVGACPIGSLQAMMGSWKYSVSLYVGGFLMLAALCWADLCAAGSAPSGWYRICSIKSPLCAKSTGFPETRRCAF